MKQTLLCASGKLWNGSHTSLWSKTADFKKYFLFLLFLCLGNISFGQVSTYTVLQETLAANPAALTKTNSFVGPNVDEGVVLQTFGGMNFVFNGVTYTSVNISINGFVYFGTASGTPASVYNPISTSNTYSGAIAAYGRDMDLITAGQNVGYTVSGTSPNRIFQIEWIARRSNGTNSSPDSASMTFQIWLYETTNVIEIYYRNFNPASFASFTGEVGLRGATNADYNNFSLTTPGAWPNSFAAGSSNSSSVLTEDDGNPITITGVGVHRIRFTPVTCIRPTSIAVGSITNTTASVTFTPPSPVPANGYQYEIRTSGAAGSGATGLAQSGTNAGSPINLTGLAANTAYTVYIRSDCSAGDFSSWTTGTAFTTICNAANIGYYLPFDGPVIPNVSPYHGALPTCTSQVNNGLGNNWVTTSAVYYPSSFMDDNILMYNGQNPGNGNAADVWFFTQGINLLANTTYRLYYAYGGTDTPSTVQNRMQVAYGLSPTNAGMTTTLDLHPNIKGSPFINMVNFTTTSAGVYYFGLKAYSNANNGQLFVDDIDIQLSVCLKSTNVTVANITSNSALLSWTAPTPAPAGGYSYYYSTSATPPSNGTPASGSVGAGVTSVTLNGLSGSTQYYFWVRTNCNGGDYGEWVALSVPAASFTTLFQPSYCAIASTASTSYFSNFTTTGGISNINNSSGYSPNGYGNYTNLIVSQSAGSSINFDTGLVGLTVGVAIWVDWDNDGIFSAAEKMYNTAAYVSAASGSFAVPGGQALGNYRMRIVMDWIATNPSACSFGGTRGEAEDYTFRVVSPPPALTISSSSGAAVCAGTASALVTITSTLSNYDTYSWSPNIGVSGSAAAGYTFTNSTTTTYTLTGTQTSSPFSVRTVTFTYNANPVPTPITITPASPSVCQSGTTPVALTATGGVVSGVPILNENFNTGAADWTVTNSGVAVTTWGIQNSGYNPGGFSGISSVISNDASQFYISNSDAGGSGSSTNTTLTSPIFSLAGYTNATVSFYHYYKPWINGSAVVEIFNEATGLWDVLQTWGTTATTGSQGTPTGFVNVSYNLAPYIGNSTVQIRFKYVASWGYVWAIDNLLVSGSTTTAITWSPTTNLYTDAAGTVAYTGTAAATVYALPSADTIYTASASTTAPVCTTSTPVTVTVTPFNTGTASSDQNLCGGTVADLTLTGHSGSVVNWQYSPNATFLPVGSVVNIASSNSATLTAAQIGALTATRYFRAVVSNGTCTGNSNVVTITVDKAIWNGLAWSNVTGPSAAIGADFQGNYTSSLDPQAPSGNLSACSVTVTSGNVLFDIGTLTVQNQVNVLGGTLAFADDASLYQVSDVVNLPGVYSGGNTGNITYERTAAAMFRYDYTYWSTPVSPQTLLAVSPSSPQSLAYEFNAVVNNWAYFDPNNVMGVGKGYIFRAPTFFNLPPDVPLAHTAQFIGVPNNGIITVPVVGGADQMNLLGNPYPSALDANDFISANLDINGTLYFWTHNTQSTAPYVYNPSDYALYNLGGGTAAGAIGSGNNTAPTKDIASGQGFFVKGLNTGTATFNNGMREAGNNSNFYRNASTVETNNELEKHRYWLNMTSESGAFKQLMLGYIESATNDIDRLFDGEMVDSGNIIGLYTLVEDTKLSIQGRALPFDVNETLPLGYECEMAGSFTIALSSFDGLFTSQTVYLEDTLLGVIHNLKLSPYTFVSESGTFNTRFILRYTTQALGNNNPLFNENTVVVYQNQTGLHINSGTQNMKNVTIFDIRGRQIASQKQIANTETVFTTLPTTQQVLLVKIEGENGTVVTKKVVY